MLGIRSGGARRILAILAIAALAACESAEERLANHYERGMALLEEGAPEKARLEFQNALRLNGDHAPSRLQIAKLFEMDGEYRAAVSNFRLTTELDPQNVEARIRLARILLLADDADGAATYAEAAVALEPQNAEALALAGSALVRGEASAHARGFEMVEQALALDPANETANAAVLARMVQAGELDAALARLDELLASNPENRAFNTLRLRLMGAMGDDDGLLAQLSRMTTLYPQDVPLKRAYATALAATGDQEGAERTLREIAAATPDNIEASLDIVRLIARGDRIEDALDELDRQIAVAEDPARRAQLRLVRADLTLENGDADAGAAQLESLIADGPAEPANRARLRLAQIRRAEGDDTAARALIDAVIAGDARNADALSMRASYAMADGDSESAANDLRQALEERPRDPALLFALGQAHAMGGSMELSTDSLAAAARASDFNPDYALPYAAALQRRGQNEAAEKVLSESARRNPDAASVLLQLARVRLQIGDWAGAEAVAAQLESVSPATAQQLRAASLSGQGRSDESISMLRSLAETDDAQASARAALVVAYVSSGRVADAEAFVDELLLEDPKDLQLLLLRAEIHLLQGEAQAAEARLRELVATGPAVAETHIALARFLMMGDRAADARQVLLEGIEGTSGDPRVRLLLAGLYETQRDFDAAIAEYQTLHDANPADPVVANNLASLLADYRSDDPEALESARRIASRLRGSTVPHFQDTYGWVLFLTGDNDGALRSLRRAAEGLPDNALVQYHYGRALAEAGQTAAARAALEKSLAVETDFTKAQSALDALAALEQATQ